MEAPKKGRFIRFTRAMSSQLSRDDFGIKQRERRLLNAQRAVSKPFANRRPETFLRPV